MEGEGGPRSPRALGLANEKPTRKLNPKQKRFVKEYLIDSNGTQAAIRAGYSKKNADKIAWQLLGNPRVAAAVEHCSAKISDKLEITAERIRAELAKLAFSNMEDYVVHENGDITPDLSKCTRDHMAAVQEFSVDSTGGTGDGERKLILRTKFKLAPKREALELLGRCRDIQLFADKVDVSHSIQTMSDEELMAKYEQLKAKENG